MRMYIEYSNTSDCPMKHFHASTTFITSTQGEKKYYSSPAKQRDFLDLTFFSGKRRSAIQGTRHELRDKRSWPDRIERLAEQEWRLNRWKILIGGERRRRRRRRRRIKCRRRPWKTEAGFQLTCRHLCFRCAYCIRVLCLTLIIE